MRPGWPGFSGPTRAQHPLAASLLGPPPHTQTLPPGKSDGTVTGRNLSWASITPSVNVFPQEVLAGPSLGRNFRATRKVWVWEEGASGRRLGGSWIIVGKDDGAPEEGAGHGDRQVGQEVRVRPPHAWVLG